jgi:hypothetical protein
LEKTSRKAGSNEVKAYELRFTPPERGDYVFVLRTPPIWMEEEGEFLQDTVKSVLHVQVQKGWDAAAGDFELVPLTRPYGLRAGMVFQAETDIRSPLFVARQDLERKMDGGKRMVVEIERYNTDPPKTLPPDEHITRTVRLDQNGVATTTLSEPGWWCLTVSRPQGTRMRDGKSYPLRQRATLWVYVDEPARSE